MFTTAKVLVFAASCALLAQAQSSTGSAPASQTSLPAGLNQCIINCSTQAATSAGCGTFTNLTCVCTSTAFQAAAASCLAQNCPNDIATAQQIASQECSSLTASSATASSTAASSSGAPSSGASSSGASTTAASTATSVSSSATQSATSSSAAMALGSPFSLGGLLGTLFASAGALVGAAIVL